MDRRRLGSTGWSVSEIGIGTWQLGGGWGDPPSPEASQEVIHTALDAGVTFIDTADVYGDGRSEQQIAAALNDREDTEDVVVATKAGRRLDPHTAEGYNHENLERFVDRSREYLSQDTLDLVQLHCPPREAYYQPETFEALADLKAAGKLAHYGVSVEKVEEALKAIEYPGVETVQIIFNAFRQRPAEMFFEEAKRRDIGVIVRVPLASGLLTGDISADETFAENDHRNFNREGKAFDKGETFAGVPLKAGIRAVEELRPSVPEDATMTQWALRWILMHDAVTTIIPGTTSPEHIQDNVAAADLPALSHEVMGKSRDVYKEYIHDAVHHRW